ncbi:MAG: 4-(cytidine 5'-diphospho)-2-C-methyl-D-erythritol kinase [Pseudomonadota bacterium]
MVDPQLISEQAPAKINLYLHVGGLRPDGLHDLASLFVFVDAGDVITVEPRSRELSFDITGPFSNALSEFDPQSNLVMQAAHTLRKAFSIDCGAHLILDKRLPIASGIGGGSADAAAAIRALVRLWEIRASIEQLESLAFSLGADVPACLTGSSVFVSGAGEKVVRANTLPPLWVAVVNPLVATPTGPVFRSFDRANLNPDPPVLKKRVGLSGVHAVEEFMAQTKNDLQPIAVVMQPVIADTLDCLGSEPGCISVRMSGSGASVFGLFTSLEAARRAARVCVSKGWWAIAAPILR